MFISLKKRNELIKKTAYDLWGHYIRYWKVNKAINFVRVIHDQNKKRYEYYDSEYTYTLKERVWFRRRKKYKPAFIAPRFLKSFYLVLTLNKFRYYMKVAKRKIGSFESNYLGFIEGRIFMLVYRANFVTNLFMIRELIWHGFFAVNGVIKYHINYVVNVGQMLHPSTKEKRQLIRIDMINRLKSKIIIRQPPAYLFTNYIFMFVILKHKIKWRDIQYPNSFIDPFIVSQYSVPAPK